MNNAPNTPIDVVLLAGCDYIDTNVNTPYLREAVLKYKNSKTRKEQEKKKRIYNETFYGPGENKNHVYIDGKPLVQRALDSIAEAEQSEVAKELGLEGIIGRIAIAGEKEWLEENITPPLNKEVIITEQGHNQKTTAENGIYALMGGETLPDNNEGLTYISDKDMAKSSMDWKTKSLFEYYGVLANEIAKKGEEIERYKAEELIKERQNEQYERNHLPKRLRLSGEEIASYILDNSDIIKIKNDKITLKSPEALNYFKEFYEKSEKPFVLAHSDNITYNPGIIHTIAQYLNKNFVPEVMMSFTTAQALKPYSELGFKERPYMHLENRVRINNLAVGKPNKVGNLASGQNSFDNRRMLNIASAIGNGLNISYDFQNKEFNFNNAKLVAKALYNNFWIKKRLCKNAYNYDSGKREKMLQKYKELRENSSIQDWEKALSFIIKARVAINISPFGAMSLDNDSYEDTEQLGNLREEIEKQEQNVFKHLKQNDLLNEEKYREHVKDEENKIIDSLFSASPDEIHDFFSK